MSRFALVSAVAIAAITGLALAADAPSNVPADYKGKVFTDEKVTAAQKIPGVVNLAYFDAGGEGVAYHDHNKKNEGSGGLNGGGKDYESKLRRDEAVDISYTKGGWDDTKFNKVTPAMKMPYVGWTGPGEWLNYTLEVTEDGTYTIDLLYTSHHGGEIAIDVNGKEGLKEIKIEATAHPQSDDAHNYHLWNLAKNIGELKLTKGLNLITFKVVKEGSMNLGTLEFKKK
jgi:hypothetical protein